jgi:hypothetical protein
MRAYKPCVVLALVAGISVGTYAQGTQPILKLPNDIEFKAPVGPGTQNAVLYGDPTKEGASRTSPSPVQTSLACRSWFPRLRPNVLVC